MLTYEEISLFFENEVVYTFVICKKILSVKCSVKIGEKSVDRNTGCP